MAEPMLQNDERLDLARLLVNEMESGNEDEVSRLITEISRQQEASLFTEIGKLTRQLHDSLRNVEVDERLSAIAAEQIPDAKERLNYVIKCTEDAANRTLTAVEEALPMVSEINNSTQQLSDDWSRFRRREMSVEEFRELSEKLDGYLDATGQKTTDLQNQLNEVLMAQDFQDLTGQVIKKVIELVHQVEEGLVSMIRLSGSQYTEVKPKEKGIGVEAEGPQMDSADGKNVVNGQDDVDDLLSSLGF